VYVCASSGAKQHLEDLIDIFSAYVPPFACTKVTSNVLSARNATIRHSCLRQNHGVLWLKVQSGWLLGLKWLASRLSRRLKRLTAAYDCVGLYQTAQFFVCLKSVCLYANNH